MKIFNCRYYLHQFSAQQPDLNYRNPTVVNEMKEVMKYYMDKGVAGFRLDAVSFASNYNYERVCLINYSQINHMFEDDQFRDEPRNQNVQDPNDYE